MKSLMMIGIGLALGTVGMETVAGYMRTPSSSRSWPGDRFSPARWAFGISEVLVTAEETVSNVQLQKVRFRELWPTLWSGSAPLAGHPGLVHRFFVGLRARPSPVIAKPWSPTRSSASSTATGVRPGQHRRGRRPGGGQQRRGRAAYVPLMALGIRSRRSWRWSWRFFIINGSPRAAAGDEKPDLFSGA